MISCEDLTLEYPASGFRLSIPSLVVAPCEKVAIIGPSGSGKTSLLDLIAGVRLPVSGSIVVHETEISRLGDSSRRRFRLRNIGFVFQTFELFDYLTVRENLLLLWASAGFTRVEQKSHEARLPNLMTRLELGEMLDRRVSQLSRGEQQRVAVGRALIHRPPLILADEPTGNLDPGNKSKAMKLFLEAVSGDSATLLVATHDESLLPYFDRVIDLNELRQPS